jgi:chemotaxis signal transduction protein
VNSRASQRKLVSLQRSLMPGEAVAAGGKRAVPFIVGGRKYALAGDEVLRVLLADRIVELVHTPATPPCVVGAALCEPNVVTVLDAGWLFDGPAVAASMSARLVVLNSKQMQGFALLVDRVLDIVEEAQVPQDVVRMDGTALAQKLDKHTKAHRAPMEG